MTGHWVLIGLMGSGKSSVGVELARLSGRRYIDNDDTLEDVTGRTARELQEEVGADRLHELEVDALARALDDPEPAIVGAAAAVVTNDEGLRQLERAGAVVWLHAPAEVLAERVMSGGDHRPLGDAPADTLAAQLAERAEAYEAAATLVVDDTGTPAELAESILATLTRDAAR